MDLVHHEYSLLLEGKLHLAPVDPNAQRVLDLGTGTGIWAIDFAELVLFQSLGCIWPMLTH
jgi:methylase of polypeptide subunit release factors